MVVEKLLSIQHKPKTDLIHHWGKTCKMMSLFSSQHRREKPPCIISTVFSLRTFSITWPWCPLHWTSITSQMRYEFPRENREHASRLRPPCTWTSLALHLEGVFLPCWSDECLHILQEVPQTTPAQWAQWRAAGSLPRSSRQGKE